MGIRDMVDDDAGPVTSQIVDAGRAAVWKPVDASRPNEVEDLFSLVIEELIWTF